MELSGVDLINDFYKNGKLKIIRGEAKVWISGDEGNPWSMDYTFGDVFVLVSKEASDLDFFISAFVSQKRPPFIIVDEFNDQSIAQAIKEDFDKGFDNKVHSVTDLKYIYTPKV